jgi:hypothetical protein
MSTRRRHTSRTIARDSYDLALAAPEVVARRVAGMWLAGKNPSQRDRAELHRMSSEKIVAFHESWNAMVLELFRLNVELALSAMWDPWRVVRSRRASARIQQAVAAVYGAGLAPVRRRAVANAKRLRRARR